MRVSAFIFALLATAAPSYAEVLKGEGSSMVLELQYGIKINEGSSLKKEWVIVTDDKIPVKIISIIPSINYKDNRWERKIEYQLMVNEDVQAVEVRFIPFDIWGEKSRTLSATEIRDFSAGTQQLNASWNIFGDNEATNNYALLGYVAQVKLASGAILRADAEAVVDAAQEFSDDFTSGDLEVNEEKP